MHTERALVRQLFRCGLLFGALAAVGACSPEPPPPVIAGDYRIEQWVLPSQPGAAQPDLVGTADGRLLLSWISSPSGRRPAFQFAELYPDGHWEGPRTIVIGNALLANWTDTPHIAATADRALWVHWLQKSSDAPDAYDVMLSRSLNHGMNWSGPRKVHDDISQSQHGFVAFWPQTESSLGVAWLDGRHTLGSGEAHDGAHDTSTGDAVEVRNIGMSLRAAVFDADLNPSAASEIDTMVCDCCQTDAVGTAEGGLLVYRDRSADDIRDIYATRFDGKAWSAPKRVYADDWKMTACPVNGPAVAATAKNAVVAWYTGAGGKPAIKLARSGDGGADFAAPVTVESGDNVIGRVALAVDDAQVWVLWMRETAPAQGKPAAQSLWLARYAPDLSHELQRIELAKPQAQGHATGFPKLVVQGGAAFVVWTDAADGESQLRGVSVVPVRPAR